MQSLISPLVAAKGAFRAMRDRSRCPPEGDAAPARARAVRGLAAAAIVALSSACDDGARGIDAEAPGAGASPVGPGAIVSFDPGATDFVLALGAGERLVVVGGAAALPDGLERRPRVDVDSEVDIDQALALAPDWIFVPSLLGDQRFASLRAQPGIRVVEFEPHDLEDLFALSRTVGREIVGRARADAFEVRISRPLSLIAAESHPTERPRVAAIVAASPLLLGGGHSFASDLLEIAGASSVTHGGEEHRLPASATGLRALDLDALVLMLPDASERRRALEALPPEIPTIALEWQAHTFWRDPEPARFARELRQALLEVEADPGRGAESSTPQAAAAGSTGPAR